MADDFFDKLGDTISDALSAGQKSADNVDKALNAVTAASVLGGYKGLAVGVAAQVVRIAREPSGASPEDIARMMEKVSAGLTMPLRDKDGKITGAIQRPPGWKPGP